MVVQVTMQREAGWSWICFAVGEIVIVGLESEDDASLTTLPETFAPCARVPPSSPDS